MAKAKPPGMNKWGDVADTGCLGRQCLNVHEVAIRGATGAGSRTSGYRFCCATRDYNGCPYPFPESDPELEKERKKAGWKIRKW